jgi:hypothetical protein
MVMDDYMYYDFDPSKATPKEIEQMQFFIDTDRDGKWGPKSQKALDKFKREYERRNADRLYLDNLLSANELRGDMDDAERLGGTTLPKPRTTFNYLPGLQTTGSQYNAKNVLGLDDFSAPDMQPVENPNSERIAQLEARLAEIAKERKAFDTEEEMGKYKFLYEGDPSTYVTVKQNKRNAEETKKIREANDRKADRENLRNSWKESGTSLLVARYDLADAENAYRQAVASGDPDGISKAGIARSRALANYQTKLRENDILRAKVYESFGIKDEPGSDTKVTDPYAPENDENYRSAQTLQRSKNDLDLLEKEVKTDNIAIDKTLKKEKIAEWTSRLDELEGKVKASTLDDKNRGTLETQIQSIREAIRNFGKPAGKGGQGTKVTQEEVNRMNFTDLKRKGYQWLVGIKNAGLTHPDLDKAINSTREKK